jgi:Flp pilus assembly protein TadD
MILGIAFIHSPFHRANFMFRLPGRTWMAAKLSWRRALLLAGVCLLGMAVSAPQLWAWHHLHQGRSELEHFRLEEARRHLNTCLRIWPRHVEAHLLAAQAARQLGDFDDAEKHLRQAQPPFTPKLQRAWTMHRAAQGDLKETEPSLLPLVEQESEDALPACEALIQGYQRTYRFPQALNLLDLWQKRRPDDVRPLLLRGRLMMHLSGWQRAEPDYRRALQLEPECEEARHGLARCLTEIDSGQEAALHWEVLRQRHPEALEVRVHLARCLGRLGQTQKARQMFAAVLQERPDYYLALFHLGQLLINEQQPAEAEIWLRRAISVAPHNQHPHWFLYRALLQQDKTDEAEREMEKAKKLELSWERLTRIVSNELAKRPHDAAVQAELGVLLLELGDETSGRNWLRSALQEDPNCAAALSALQESPSLSSRQPRP